MSEPSIMGTNIDPCVIGSVAMSSYELLSANVMRVPAFMYTLVPGPVPTHKVTILSLFISKVTVWGIVST